MTLCDDVDSDSDWWLRHFTLRLPLSSETDFICMRPCMCACGRETESARKGAHTRKRGRERAQERASERAREHARERERERARARERERERARARARERERETEMREERRERRGERARARERERERGEERERERGRENCRGQRNMLGAWPREPRSCMHIPPGAPERKIQAVCRHGYTGQNCPCSHAAVSSCAFWGLGRMARRARVKIVALLCLTQGCARASVSLELLRCSDGWSHARVCVRVCVCACVRVVCVCACVGDQKDGGAVPLSCPAEMQF